MMENIIIKKGSVGENDLSGLTARVHLLQEGVPMELVIKCNGEDKLLHTSPIQKITNNFSDKTIRVVTHSGSVYILQEL